MRFRKHLTLASAVRSLSLWRASGLISRVALRILLLLLHMPHAALLITEAVCLYARDDNRMCNYRTQCAMHKTFIACMMYRLAQKRWTRLFNMMCRHRSHNAEVLYKMQQHLIVLQSSLVDEITPSGHMRCGCMSSACFSAYAQVETHVLLHV